MLLVQLKYKYYTFYYLYQTPLSHKTEAGLKMFITFQYVIFMCRLTSTASIMYNQYETAINGQVYLTVSKLDR